MPSTYLVLSTYFKCPHTNDLTSSSAQPCEPGRPGIISTMLFPSIPSGSLKSPQIVSSILQPTLNQQCLRETGVLCPGSLLGLLAAVGPGLGVTRSHRMWNHSSPGISQTPLPLCLYLKTWHIMTMSPSLQGAASDFPSLGKWKPEA